MEIMDRIHNHYPSMSRAQRRIANFILEHPEDACFASLKELTEAVETTEVTVVNFTRKIGLNSFVSLKKELQAHIRMRLSPNDKIARAIRGIADPNGIFQELTENESAALAQTYAGLDENALRKAVSLIRNAKRIYIIGNDVSLPVADFLSIRLHYLGFHAIRVGFAEPGRLLLEISRAQKEDLFVFLSFPKHAPELVRAARCLQGRGIDMIAITDQDSAVLSCYASLTLYCMTGDLLFYNSITAPISLVNLLSTLLAVEMREDLYQIRSEVETLSKLIYDTP